MHSLNEIIRPVAGDMVTVKETIAELLHSPVRLINIIANHLIKQKGKMLRPLLVLLAGRVCSELTPETFRAAALVEMLHNATLIHDDVVDESTVRRGGPTISAIWKNKISVLMGDYLLARSLTTAVKLNSLVAINILSESSARMSQGEIAQLIKSRKKDLSEEDYFQIIGDKTAALISASMQLGAISVSASQEQEEKLKLFGEKIGLAFQIQDDLLDIEGEEKVFGKKRGTDIKNGKITLPLIYALKQVGNSQRGSIIKKVKKNPSKSDIKTIIHFIKDNGGVQYASEKAAHLAKEACAELSDFDNSDYKTSLLNVTDYMINRSK